MPKPTKEPSARSKKSAAPAKTGAHARRTRVSGRPVGSASVGRQAIVDSTIELLKSRPPESLTVLEVAKVAGVTRALVRYYFGSLEGLLVEVTEQLMSVLQGQMEEMTVREGTLYERVRQRLSLRLDFMREHPHFERLVLSEIYFADDGQGRQAGSAQAESALKRITRRGLEISAMLLDERSARHVDARFLHLTIMSISGYITAGEPLIRTLFGTGKGCERQLEAYIDFVARLLTDHLETLRAPD